MPTPKPYTATDGVVTYRVRLRHNGKQTSETFPSKVQALAFCALIDDIGPEAAVAQRNRADLSTDDYVPTVAEMLERHVTELTGVQADTRAEYRALARRTWLPIIGKYRVDTVTRSVVAGVVNELDGRHAPKTIKNAHSLMSGVMESALRDDKIPANPCRGIRLPRTGEDVVEEIRFLTPDDFDLLHDTFPEQWRPLLVTMFGTGARWGEISALQVCDVNLYDIEGATLRIVRAWKKGRTIGPPKSRASRRTIALPQQVVDVLEPLVANRPAREWLFTTEGGAPVRHNNFWDRVWRPAVVRASICDKHLDPECRCIRPKHQSCPVHTEFEESKVAGRQGAHILAPPCGCAGTLNPRPRIHDARHTHASWLIANGTRLEVIQDRLGHEDYLTTRRVYGHLMPDMRREAAVAAQVAFNSTRLAITPAGTAPALAESPR